jgi:RNA polymerase sigma-70 factor (ECF subfamily)
MYASREGGARFGSVYKQHRSWVYLRCRRLLIDPTEAEDAVQEIFLRVARHVGGLADPEELRPWINCITTNYCLNQLRGRKRRGAVFGDGHEEPPHHRQAEAALVDRDLVQHLLRSVPGKLGSSAWFHFVDGMSYDEVGTRTGYARRSIVNHVAEFRERARTLLGREA